MIDFLRTSPFGDGLSFLNPSGDVNPQHSGTVQGFPALLLRPNSRAEGAPSPPYSSLLVGCDPFICVLSNRYARRCGSSEATSNAHRLRLARPTTPRGLWGEATARIWPMWLSLFTPSLPPRCVKWHASTLYGCTPSEDSTALRLWGLSQGNQNPRSPPPDKVHQGRLAPCRRNKPEFMPLQLPEAGSCNRADTSCNFGFLSGTPSSWFQARRRKPSFAQLRKRICSVSFGSRKF